MYRKILLIVLISVCIPLNAYADEGNEGVPGRVTELEEQVLVLQGQVMSLLELLEGVSRFTQYYEGDPVGYDTLLFTGMNVQIINGEGGNREYNGEGNLIIGYSGQRGGSECPGGDLCDRRTGSHNLVMGFQNNYTAHGGLVSGILNEVSGSNASILGSRYSMASGNQATVTGGFGNIASGPWSSVSGGNHNTASGEVSSVSGGSGNEAFGTQASVSGGAANIASGLGASVSGGEENTASGDFTWISGGLINRASSPRAAVVGGYNNEASGVDSAVIGGGNNHASGHVASVSGGDGNAAIGTATSISGGEGKTAAFDICWTAGTFDDC